MGKDIDWTSVGDLASEQFIDSRDMEKAIDALEERADWEPDDEQTADDNPNPLDDDETALLKTLHEVRDSCGCEWRYGVTYIRESEWEDYCRELADDCGYTGTGKQDDNPLLNYIDWEGWAEAVRQDYSSIEIDGTTFYYRD